MSKLTYASLRHKVAREKMQDWLAGTQKGMVWYGMVDYGQVIACYANALLRNMRIMKAMEKKTFLGSQSCEVGTYRTFN